MAVNESLWSRWRKRWQASAADARRRREEARANRLEARREARSRRVGFLRFYGERILRIGRAARRFVARMIGTHRGRTPLQRALFGFVAAGAITGVALVVDWNLTGGLNPYRAILERTAKSPAAPGDAGAPAGGITAGTPMGIPGGSAGGVDPLAAEQQAAQIAERLGPGSISKPLAEAPDPVVGAPQTNRPDESAAQPRFIPIPSIPAASVSDMLWPVEGVVQRPFGWYRHPVFGEWRHSSAMILDPSDDDGTVRAALAGRVRDVVNEGGLWTISIEHAGGWTTVYQDLTEVFVDSFAVVGTGEPVGRAEGPLPQGGIAFSVRREDVAVDPNSLIQAPALPALAAP